MTTLKLHNTKTRKREEFVPIDPKNVRMYVCGPTVYDRAHLGNARPVIVFDVLFRLLRHVYGADKVTYVRNFTDVDDKINATALARKEEGAKGTLEELIAQRTEETIEWYHADMDAVGALRPNHAPRATQFIGQMQDMISELIEKGFAYAVPATVGHNSKAHYVYTDSTKMPEHAFLSVDDMQEHKDQVGYGDLSGRSVEDMIAGSRAEVGEGKRNPMDSVLWKPSTIEQPGWESPWGFGRPGWHIECSAMARQLLGKSFDIHGGGLDLLFPHHENELAQCKACDGAEASANYWLHNEMLQVEGKKMSKSLGNFFTVRDLLDQGVPGEVIRFVMLSTHYRKPMDWTEKKREEAEKTLRKWYLLVENVPEGKLSDSFVDALADDLNTPKAITELHYSAQGIDFEQKDIGQLRAGLKFLSLLPEDLHSWGKKTPMDSRADALVKNLMSQRWEFREAKLWAEADKIRDALKDAGVQISENKDGSYKFEFLPGFDPTKLEALK
ncbi:cysteine--tRNA ligase [Sulfitobacter sp. HNIBRBA2951]|uniref:cysteine--tRNA ligase n=1 Tax=Sulfitobacter aquimarinus TaxID=3158557 RepID=UPI0032DF9B7D